MGDFQGHPFRGNQYTRGGITATFDPNLKGEARNLGPGKYVVGPKFLSLPQDVQAHILKHEEGHDLSDAMLKDGSAWDALDAGILPTELNGQTTPGEIIAEAYAVLHSDPTWLWAKHPKLANFIQDRMKRTVWHKNPRRE